MGPEGDGYPQKTRSEQQQQQSTFPQPSPSSTASNFVGPSTSTPKNSTRPPRRRQSLISSPKKNPPSPLHNSRLSKPKIGAKPASPPSSTGFFSLLCQYFTGPWIQIRDTFLTPNNTNYYSDYGGYLQGIIHPVGPVNTEVYSSDDEDQRIYPVKKSNCEDFVHRFVFWGRGGFRGIVNSWVSNQLSPGWRGGWRDNYYHRGHLGQGIYSDTIMTRVIDLSVTKLALLSRLLLLGIQMLANNLLDNARHHNDGFRFLPEKGDGDRVWDPVVNATLGGFANWDGQYFLHIAVKGYTSEQIMAFFPLFPMTVSYMAWVFHLVLGWYISFSSMVLVVSWILNTTLFVKTANMLYHLVGVAGVNVDPLPVIILFCFNPASIFFSGMYTEAMFMYLTMKVLLSLYDGLPYKALFWVALSTLCRSNGILNFGFVAAYFLQVASIRFWRERKSSKEFLFYRAIACAIALLPFLIYQGYAIYKFCDDELSTLPPYCRYEKLPYSYIQEEYWSVGPFKYFQFKQLPNFILAAPILYHQFTKSWRKLAPLVAKFCVNPRGGVNLFSLYIAAHGAFLAMFCFIFIHVQVSTRLILSAFPYIYLYIVESCADEIVAFRQRTIHWPIEAACSQIWCAVYFIVGTIAFSLGYPWT